MAEQVEVLHDSSEIKAKGIYEKPPVEVEIGELFQVLQSVSQGNQEEKMNEIFSLFDANGDGQISKEEFLQVIKTIWDHPQALGLLRFAQEEAQIYGSEVFVKRVFHELDLNKDGFISREEYLAACKSYLRVGAAHIMETQTGGHVDAFKIIEHGKLMKKVGKSEFSFYRSILHTIEHLPQFCPQFFGVHEENDNGKLNNYIIMEDLCVDYKKPCILDLKMGLTSAGEDAAGDKLEDMRKKDLISTTCSLGMRFTGMRVWNETKGNFDRYNKSWGRAVTPDSFNSSLLLFFTNGIETHTPLFSKYLEKLEALHAWISKQSHLRFYSSSLLFLYDAEDIHKEVRLKMIDFAHVFPVKDNGVDEGYIFGLTQLITRLKSLIQIHDLVQEERK